MELLVRSWRQWCRLYGAPLQYKDFYGQNGTIELSLIERLLMNIIAMLADLLGSRTLGLAIRLIPYIGKAWDKAKADEWIFDKIKGHVPNATFDEMKQVIATGKAFTAACYAFLHK